MLKLFKALTILFLINTACYSQTIKLFIAEDGSISDSVKAQSYVICKQLSDSLWMVRQFGMDDTIMTEGSYKDKELTVAHGKFVYYAKELQSNQNPKPINYRKQTGEFINGERNGAWIEFLPDSRIREIYTYKMGKRDGLYEMYGGVDGALSLKGSYQDDLKEGEWILVSKTGDLIRTEHFSRGKLKNASFTPLPYKAPVQPSNFDKYIATNVVRLLGDKKGRVFVNCKIDRNGRLTDAKFSGIELSADTAIELKNLILKSATWGPIYNTKTKQFTDGDLMFIIEMKKDGNVSVQYSPLATEKSLQYFN